MSRSDWGSLIFTGCLIGLVFAYIFPTTLWLSGEYAIGRPTRDLFDHLALLDHWGTQSEGWNFPEGGKLMPPDISGMILASPWFVFGRATAFNIALLSQVLLCGGMGWILGRQFGSGIVGGLSMALSPILLGQLFSGEAETLSAWTIPLFFFVLFMPSLKKNLYLGIVTAIAGVFSWYYGAYLGIVLFFHCLWDSRVWSKNRRVSAFKPLGYWLIFISPFAIWYGSILWSGEELFRGLTMTGYMANHPRAVSSFSADPVAWLLGSSFDASHIDYLGWVPLIFALYGGVQLWKDKNPHIPFLVLVIVFSLLMSIGPILHLRGTPWFNWMPYRFFLLIPQFDMMRLPHRWMMVCVAAMVPLIARGTAKSPMIFVVLLLGEVVWFSAPQSTITLVQPPSIVDRYEGPVLELPARTMNADARGKYLLWQKYHQHEIPYSLLMTAWSSVVAKEPLAQWVSAKDSRDLIAERVVEAEQFRQGDFANAISNVQETELEGAKDRLKAHDFWGVVLHVNLLDKEDTVIIQRKLEEIFGLPTLESDEAILWAL